MIRSDLAPLRPIGEDFAEHTQLGPAKTNRWQIVLCGPYSCGASRYPRAVRYEYDGADDRPVVYPSDHVRQRNIAFEETYLCLRQQKQISDAEASPFRPRIS
jgi:hypothetical protein